MLEAWMQSYRPEELFDETRRAAGRRWRSLRPPAIAAWGRTRMPTADACCSICRSPISARMRSRSRHRAPSTPKTRACSGAFFETSSAPIDAPRNFRIFGPDETVSNRLDAVFEATARQWEADMAPDDQWLAPDGQRRGGAQRTSVPGLARRLSADRPSRAVQHLRSVRPHRRLDVQPAREVAEGDAHAAVAAADRVAQLPAGQPCVASGSQRLHASGSRASSTWREQESGGRARLSAAGCQLPAERDGSLPAQPALREHCRRRQAPGAAVAGDGRRDSSLRRRDRPLGLGQQR